MTTRLISIDLFAGGGGLALGLERAGFEHLGLVEWDRRACETLRANAGKAAQWSPEVVRESDAALIDYTSFTGVDLVAGGVPCQPFSLGGIHRGDVDRRNQFPVLLEAVRAARPKAVLIENVPGILRPAFRSYFEYILDQLRLPAVRPADSEDWRSHRQRLVTELARREAEYSVDWRLINAADFGAPQRRVRVLIQALRSDVAKECVWPNPSHSERRLVGDLDSGVYWAEHRISGQAQTHVNPRSTLPLFSDLDGAIRRWATVRDALVGLGPPKHVKSLQASDHVIVPGARVYPGHTGSMLDEPAKTLKAGVHGVPGGEATVVLDDGSVRYFTVREAARVQGFPDDYIFVGSRSDKMRQIGNAVAVNVAMALGLELTNVLGRDRLPEPDRARLAARSRPRSLVLTPG
jgi:DNA (cytosine-5)-methyltransferase 1